MDERRAKAVKLLNVIVSGKTIISYGSAYESGRDGKFLMSMSDLAIAVSDVNLWLCKNKISGRISRLDCGGTPRWGLVDL
jgi:hypothetical protein